MKDNSDEYDTNVGYFKGSKNLDTLSGLHKEYKRMYLRANRAVMDRPITPDEAVKLSNILDKIHKIREHVEIAQYIKEWKKEKELNKKKSKTK